MGVAILHGVKVILWLQKLKNIEQDHYYHDSDLLRPLTAYYIRGDSPLSQAYLNCKKGNQFCFSHLSLIDPYKRVP